MKVVFISNFLNHHQLSFCFSMLQLTNNSFWFVATERIPQSRLDFGYSDMNELYPFVVRTYESVEADNKAKRIAYESDVVVIGSAPDKYIIPRLKARKLTFKYSERFYKQGLPLIKIPRSAASAWIHHGRFQRYPIYMLCASAYTAADTAVFHNYTGRTYKWGYFPQVVKYNDEFELMRKKCSLGDEKGSQRVSILWAGRLIPWKHPELVVELALSLKQQGYRFKLSIIGNGDMEAQLHEMIDKEDLSDCVEMLGPMSPDCVRQYMEVADVFTITSDFNEGWGAVLNEAMNSGCAVVASHAIGSVPFLINDGENGLIYQNGNQADLEAKVVELLENREKRIRLGKNAYRSILALWNADIAAERLLILSQKILKNEGSIDSFVDGPCSCAPVLSNRWYVSSKNCVVGAMPD